VSISNKERNARVKKDKLVLDPKKIKFRPAVNTNEQPEGATSTEI
jgi:hypothetical protein